MAGKLSPKMKRPAPDGTGHRIWQPRSETARDRQYKDPPRGRAAQPGGRRVNAIGDVIDAHMNLDPCCGTRLRGPGGKDVMDAIARAMLVIRFVPAFRQSAAQAQSPLVIRPPDRLQRDPVVWQRVQDLAVLILAIDDRN